MHKSTHSALFCGGGLDEQPDLTEGFQKKMAFKNIHRASYFCVKTIQNRPTARSGVDQK